MRVHRQKVSGLVWNTQFRAVVLGEHASDYVFIDVDSERFVDLLRDPGAAEMGIALF